MQKNFRAHYYTETDINNKNCLNKYKPKKNLK